MFSTIVAQTQILDFSNIQSNFKSNATPILMRQALMQSQPPTIVWNTARRTAVGFRTGMGRSLQSTSLPATGALWSVEGSELISSNLALTGQFSWLKDGSDLALLQGYGLAYKVSDQWFTTVQFASMNQANQISSRSFDVRGSRIFSIGQVHPVIGFGINQTTCHFKTTLLPLAPASMVIKKNFLFTSWRFSALGFEYISTITVGSKLLLFSLELLKLSP